MTYQQAKGPSSDYSGFGADMDNSPIVSQPKSTPLTSKSNLRE